MKGTGGLGSLTASRSLSTGVVQGKLTTAHGRKSRPRSTGGPRSRISAEGLKAEVTEVIVTLVRVTVRSAAVPSAEPSVDSSDDPSDDP